MVDVIVVMVIVVKVMVCAAAIFNKVDVLVIDVLDGVENIVVGVIVIVLKFALPVSCSVDVLSDVAVDLFMDTLADVSTNAFAVVMTVLEFPVSTKLEGFSRLAAFDCRPLALLDCARVLQAWMPSYHV